MANNQGDILPINWPDDYRKFFHTDPMSGYKWLGGHGMPILKDYPLTKKIVDSISPTDLWNSRQCRYQLHLEPGYTVISKQPTTPKLHSLNFDDISPGIANNTKAQRQVHESNSNLHDSQNCTQAILDDTIFTVKALSDKATSDQIQLLLWFPRSNTFWRDFLKVSMRLNPSNSQKDTTHNAKAMHRITS